MTAGDIARLAPTMSALALAGENVRVAKKKKKSTGDILKVGMTNLAGLPLIQAQSQQTSLIH